MKLITSLNPNIGLKKVNENIINWAIILVISRSILLIVVQGILALYFQSKGHRFPWRSAAQWWTVYGTMVDLSCLFLLVFVLKKEGKKLSSLFDFDRKRMLNDLKLGVLVFICIFPIIGFLYSLGVGYLLFNESTLNSITGQLAERTLPNWAYYYSILIWWIVWSTTEEITYQAYSLRRLLSKYGQVKVLLFVGFFWALQHSFLPLIFDWRYFFWRLFSFFPLVIGLMIAYLKIGRITPIIIAHALMDINAALWTFKHV